MTGSDNPAGKPDDASFLSRWSRRKVEAKQTPPTIAEAAKSSTGAVAGAQMPGTPLPERTFPPESDVKQELPAIDTLTHDGDFLPFMAKDVDPGLRNQAMKKLFTDPHYQFEQMDKLDIYIDDYSIENPIPMDILRKMNQAKSLGLFDDEDDAEKEKPAVDDSTATDAAPAEAADEQPAAMPQAPLHDSRDVAPGEAETGKPGLTSAPLPAGAAKADGR